MSFVRQLISLPLRRPRFAALPALALLWLGWYFWPPQPEFCRKFGVGDSFSLTHDGDQLFVLQREFFGDPADAKSSDEHSWHVHSQKGNDRSRLVMEIISAGSPVPSPDGRLLLVKRKNDRQQLFSMDTTRFVGELPPGQWQWHPRPAGNGVLALVHAGDVMLISSDNIIQERTIRGSGEQIQFSTDGEILAVRSATLDGVELWQLTPRRYLGCFVIPKPDSQNKVGTDEALSSVRTGIIKQFCISDDGLMVAILAEKFIDIDGGFCTSQFVTVWNRESGWCSTIDLGRSSYALRIAISPNRRWLAQSHSQWTHAAGASRESAIPSDTNTIVGSSLWDIRANPPVEVRRENAWTDIRFSRSGIIAANNDEYERWDTTTLDIIGRCRVPIHWEAGIHDAGYCAAVQPNDSAKSRRPNWIPRTIRRWMVGPEYNAVVFRLADGMRTKVLPPRSPLQFTSAGELWTRLSEASWAGAGEGVLLERWSPELARPWWLYAVTAAGVGYLIWPALVRLTSRWRQTRPAGIAA
jgi:hypothetical protein